MAPWREEPPLPNLQSSEIDKLVFMKENVRLRPFQTQILECRTRPLLGENTQVMVMPLKASESQPGGAWALPPGLHVLHTYTRLKMSSSKVSVMVRNMSDCPIFLKKGIQVARVVSALTVPLAGYHWRWRLSWGLRPCRHPCLLLPSKKNFSKSLTWTALATGPCRMQQRPRSLLWPFRTSSCWMGTNSVA